MAVQTCDQAITFRNFNYARALEVVQDEEYLDDVDFDVVRLRRKQGEVFQAIDNFQEKVDNNFDILSEDSDILGEFDNEYQEYHYRDKRSLFCSSSCTSSSVTTVANVLCRKKRSIFCNDFNTTLPGIPDPTLPGIVTYVLTTAAILIAANPAPGLAPSSSPQPGSPGGGGLPSVNPGNILALVPAGLIPVATFPPFKNPFRNVDAVAAIFKEPPCTSGGENTGGEGFEPFRRSSGFSRQPSLLDRFRKNIRCLGPRLAARFGNEPAPVGHCGYGKKKRDTGYGFHEQEECGTIEDCFDLPCPRFGIVVKATFKRSAPSYGPGYGLTERQTGESFKSAAPPDCRVTG